MNKRCSHCGKEFPATEEFFWKDPRLKSGFRSWCKMCSKKRRKSHIMKGKQNWEKHHAALIEQYGVNQYGLLIPYWERYEDEY